MKITSQLCKYSASHCISAITEMQMLDIISTHLKHSENKPGDNNFLTETLSLLGAFVPDSLCYKNDDSDFAKNEKTKNIPFESSEGVENSYKVTLIESILPSMLRIFASSFNQNIKFSLLQLIEEIILMLSGQTLKTYLQPHLFSRFVISTMKTDNYTWIEICLRIMLLLTEKKVTTVNLSLHREGIRDYLSVFGDEGKFKELTGIEIKDEEEEKKAKIPQKNKKEKIIDFFGKQQKEPIKTEKTIDKQEKDTEIKEEKKAEIETIKEVDEKPDEEVKTKEELGSPENEVKEKEIKEKKMEVSSPIIEGLFSEDFEEEEVEGEEEDYFDELKMALQASVEEMKEVQENMDEQVDSELINEKSTSKIDKDQSKKKKAVEKFNEKQKMKKSLYQKKLKKIFIKKAIQNMDANLEELEGFAEFEEDELMNVKDIIMKKRIQLGKHNYYANPETRKYSRDFIGMNSAPMYKNIVTSAQKVFEELEKNLEEEFSEEASILERLTKISNEFLIESKNARNFDESKTTSLFQKLAEFFEPTKNFTKITQYELYKSKLIHSLQSFLSLPLKEEESKSTENDLIKEIPKNSDEYLTILSRYL